MRKTLSVAIITRNEQANLERTLGSIAWADEIVIVDSGSKDGTEGIARKFNTRFFDEPWKGLAAQRNSAIEKCTCDWVLSLDADEMLSDQLAKEIWQVLHDDAAVDGYHLPRRNLFLGRWIRHGGFYPDIKLKLFRRRSAEFEVLSASERIRFSGKSGRLKGDIVHFAYPTLAAYIEHMDRYSSRSAKFAAASARSTRSFASFAARVLLFPAGSFLYNYVLRLGFLDGREGLLINFYHSVSRSWKYAKAWEITRG
jgi:glycosyltransferase involved in cell wall biosynthesis